MCQFQENYINYNNKNYNKLYKNVLGIDTLLTQHLTERIQFLTSSMCSFIFKCEQELFSWYLFNI